MNLVNVNDQLANVAQILRKCPTVTLRRAYVRALRDWCSQTQWLRMNVPGASQADVKHYTLGDDPQLEIVGIFAMKGSHVIAGKTQSWPIVPTDSGDWFPDARPGRPTRYAYIPEGQFALNVTPDKTYDLLITVILQPKDDAVNIPESPLLKYSNEIEAGALAYLFDISGQPWTSPINSVKYGKQFASGISNGKAEAQRKFNTGAQRARPRRFIIA